VGAQTLQENIVDATFGTIRASHRPPVAALSKLTAGALGGLVLVLLALMLLIGEVIPPVMVISALAILVAAMIMAGWRWAPMLATLLCATVLALFGSTLVYDLMHPEELAFFTAMLIAMTMLLGGIVGGAAATIQNYRHAPADRRMPRGLPLLLATIAGLLVGAILVAAIPRVDNSVSAEVLAGLPPVVTEEFDFVQKELRVKVGDTVALRLENHDRGAHSFDIDELNVHTFMPTNQSRLALFKPTQPGTFTFYCSVPGHANKAAGTGMVGTLIVEE
jgi:plastocyanin